MSKPRVKAGAPESAKAAEAVELQQSMAGNQIPKRPDGDTIARGTDEEPPKPAKAPATTSDVVGSKPAEVKDDKAKKPKNKPQRVEKIMVRNDFTTEGLAALGQSLADKERVLSGLQDEAKACARDYKNKVENIKTEIGATVDKLKDGFEMVEVESIVMAQVNHETKRVKKVFYRKDTGAYIKEEDALNIELDLFNQLPPKRDVKKPLEAKLLQSQV